MTVEYVRKKHCARQMKRTCISHYCTTYCTYITPLLHTGAAAILVNQESQNGQMTIGSCIPQCSLPTLHHAQRMPQYRMLGDTQIQTNNVEYICS